MKRCPECNTEFYDESLVFCLEDGSLLLAAKELSDDVSARKEGQTKFSDDFETEILSEIPTKNSGREGFEKTPETLEITDKTNKITAIKEKPLRKVSK